MLEMVENPSKKDFRLIMKILRQQNKRSIKSEKKSGTLNLVALPNLFLEFKQLKDMNSLDEITTFLLESPQVTNCYIFYDALYAWLMDKSSSIVMLGTRRVPFVLITDSFIQIFEEHMRNKQWQPLAKEYMVRKHPGLGNLSRKLLESECFTITTGYHCVRSILQYTPEELFSVDHDIKFKLTDPSTKNCNLPGHCGFILRVKAATGNNDDSFDIKLVTDQNIYDEDIHFHENSLQLENIHFTLDITYVGGKTKSLINLPVSWCGKPQRDGTGKHWCWGHNSFYKKDEGESPADNIHRVLNVLGSNSRIRPVVYY